MQLQENALQRVVKLHAQGRKKENFDMQLQLAIMLQVGGTSGDNLHLENCTDRIIIANLLLKFLD